MNLQAKSHLHFEKHISGFSRSDRLYLNTPTGNMSHKARKKTRNFFPFSQTLAAKNILWRNWFGGQEIYEANEDETTIRIVEHHLARIDRKTEKKQLNICDSRLERAILLESRKSFDLEQSRILTCLDNNAVRHIVSSGIVWQCIYVFNNFAPLCTMLKLDTIYKEQC